MPKLSEKSTLARRICDGPLVIHLGHRVEDSILHPTSPEQMQDRLTPAKQVVGDDPAVAVAPIRLRTHDGGAPLGTEPNELIECVLESRSKGVIGVISKRAFLDSHVWGLASGPPFSTKDFRMAIGNPRSFQGAFQLRRIELRIAPRKGRGTDIQQTIDPCIA